MKPNPREQSSIIIFCLSSGWFIISKFDFIQESLNLKFQVGVFTRWQSFQHRQATEEKLLIRIFSVPSLNNFYILLGFPLFRLINILRRVLFFFVLKKFIGFIFCWFSVDFFFFICFVNLNKNFEVPEIHVKVLLTMYASFSSRFGFWTTTFIPSSMISPDSFSFFVFLAVYTIVSWFDAFGFPTKNCIPSSITSSESFSWRVASPRFGS